MVAAALYREPLFAVSILAIAANGNALDALAKAMREDRIVPRRAMSLDLTSDDALNVGIAAGTATQRAAEALHALGPDLVILPGDRWEMASIATGAALAGIPIAHLGGGDRTLGSLDDKWRNVITQLATIHFATNEDALKRLRGNRLGNAGRLLSANVGSPSIDRLRTTEFWSREQLATLFGHVCDDPFVLVNWQPETASPNPNSGLDAILKAMGTARVPRAVFVGQNPDVGSMHAAEEIGIELCGPGRNWKVYDSLSPKVYLSLLKHCSCLLGNSSSGIYEAPYLGTAVINVGDRQTGRLRGGGIVQCRSDHARIEDALRTVQSSPTPGIGWDIYGDGHACEKIVDILKGYAEGVKWMQDKV